MIATIMPMPLRAKTAPATACRCAPRSLRSLCTRAAADCGGVVVTCMVISPPPLQASQHRSGGLCTVDCPARSERAGRRTRAATWVEAGSTEEAATLVLCYLAEEVVRVSVDQMLRQLLLRPEALIAHM